MVDIHCHILPGLDDGPDTLEESLKMAEMAIRDGITHVVATPHANDTFPFAPDLIRMRLKELQEKVGDRLKFATGCDFHLTFDNIKDAKANRSKYTINQKSFLLLEFDDLMIPTRMDQTLHELQLAGFDLVVTHPERNSTIRSHPERLDKWIQQGCFVQVTAGSLAGRFGKSAQKYAEQWLDEDKIHFIASDAHNVESRPLILSEAFRLVAQRKGEAVAQGLFRENPLAAFEGLPLPYVPDPAERENVSAGAHGSGRKKRFFFF